MDQRAPIIPAILSCSILFCVGCNQSSEMPGGEGGAGPPDAATTADDGPAGTGGADGADSGDGGRFCAMDSECDPHDPCLSFSCVGVTMGEFHQGHCVYEPVNGCGADLSMSQQVDGGMFSFLPPIDPACMQAPTCHSGLKAVYPPFVALAPADVPGNCGSGFEIGDADVCSKKGGGTYAINAVPNNGSRAITLDVDFATYLEPDGLVVTGIDAQGKSYTLLDTCRLQTWNAADPTGGTKRPPDQTIRQFRIDVRAGTKQLSFDFGGVVSPMYVKVLGLCDFNLTAFAQCRWYHPLP